MKWRDSAWDYSQEVARLCLGLLTGSGATLLGTTSMREDERCDDDEDDEEQTECRADSDEDDLGCTQVVVTLRTVVTQLRSNCIGNGRLHIRPITCLRGVGERILWMPTK